MKGLTDEERKTLLARVGIAPCTGGCRGLAPSPPQHIAFMERLIARGLVVWVPCEAGENCTHSRNTAAARTALMADAAARGLLVIA